MPRKKNNIKNVKPETSLLIEKEGGKWSARVAYNDSDVALDSGKITLKHPKKITSSVKRTAKRVRRKLS